MFDSLEVVMPFYRRVKGEASTGGLGTLVWKDTERRLRTKSGQFIGAENLHDVTPAFVLLEKTE